LQNQSARFHKAVNYALKLLSIRRQAIYEMECKLRKKQYEPSLITAVIERLQKDGLLDDSVYAQEFIEAHRRHFKSFGKHRLRLELSKRGIAVATVAEALASIDEESDEELALSVAQRKIDRDIKCGKCASGVFMQQDRKRIYDFLIRRGFSFSQTRSALERLTKQGKDENYT